jgi:hypothetical protein
VHSSHLGDRCPIASVGDFDEKPFFAHAGKIAAMNADVGHVFGPELAVLRARATARSRRDVSVSTVYSNPLGVITRLFILWKQSELGGFSAD